MARTELEPLLSSSMFHYKKSSDSAHLLEASSGMATPNEDELVVSQMSYTSVDSESLRKRTSSSPPGSPTDDFIQIQGNDPVAQALDQCEKWVLFPYRTVLRILGWTQFTRDGDSRLLRVLRVCLVVVWSIVIFTTFITQILCCFARDRFNPGDLKIVSNFNDSDLSDAEARNDTREITCSRHVISSFVPFDLLLLFTYWFGLYLFSHGETEYLSNLAEKVFIKQSTNKKSMHSNWRMIVTILAFFIVGFLWILMSFAVRVMTARSVRLFESQTVVRWSDDTVFRDSGKLVLISLSLIGFFTFDMVYVTAVMNYAAQSEMLIYLLRSVRGLVEQKAYTEMDGAVKDIMEVRNYLRVLNGKTATATALILYNLASAGILAIITLDEISMINSQFGEYFNENLATFAAGLNVLLWMGLVCFPFVQAARVSDECDKLKETGSFIRTRPFQYSKTPQIELDSYVTFTQAVKLRATMFGIPVYPWMAYVVLVTFTFTMLVLFQTGTYSFSYYL